MEITVDSVETTDDRNEYSDKNPAAVYLVTYTYENLGYDDDIMNGLYISLDDGIVDSAGKWMIISRRHLNVSTRNACRSLLSGSGMHRC